jgi:hypothetical protein
MKRGELWDLLEDGYEIVWDSALSKEVAKQRVYEQIDSFLDWYQKDYPLKQLLLERPQPLKLETVPIGFKEAGEFINKYHRHHVSPQGHKFSIGISDGDKLVGVIMAGHPVGRYNDDGFTLEITRCCLKSSIYKNGITKLYSAVYQAAKAFGYHRLLTFTLDEEKGVSMRACGYELDGITEGGSWNSPSRKRIDKAPVGPKKRWIKRIS